MRCRYNAVNFLTNIHKRHHIARRLGLGMVCLLWIHNLIGILLQCPMKYLTILNRIITALDSISIFHHFETICTEYIWGGVNICISIFKPSKDNDLQIEVNDNVITATSTMKILGIHIDSKLNFNGHIAFLCTKAGRQLNVWQRMRGFLCEQNGYLQQFHHFKLQLLPCCLDVYQ